MKNTKEAATYEYPNPIKIGDTYRGILGAEITITNIFIQPNLDGSFNIWVDYDYILSDWRKGSESNLIEKLYEMITDLE